MTQQTIQNIAHDIETVATLLEKDPSNDDLQRAHAEFVAEYEAFTGEDYYGDVQPAGEPTSDELADRPQPTFNQIIEAFNENHDDLDGTLSNEALLAMAKDKDLDPVLALTLQTLLAAVIDYHHQAAGNALLTMVSKSFLKRVELTAKPNLPKDAKVNVSKTVESGVNAINTLALDIQTFKINAFEKFQQLQASGLDEDQIANELIAADRQKRKADRKKDSGDDQ